MRVVAALLGLALLAPFAALLLFAANHSNLDAWRLHLPELWALPRTLLYSLTTALLACGLGALLAYQVSFKALAARRLLEPLLVCPLLLPPYLLAAIYRDVLSGSGALAQIVSLPAWPRLELASGAGFVAVMVLALYPYAYLLLRTTFVSHGSSFLELGQGLGLSWPHSLRRVLLPLSLPALLLGCALVAVETSGEWAAAVLLQQQTATVAVHELWFARGMPHLATQLSLLLALVALLLLLLSGRLAGLGARFLDVVPHDLSALRSGNDLTLLRWGRAALCAIPALLGFVLPLLVLLRFLVQTLPVIDLGGLFATSLDTLLLLLAVTALSLLFAALLSAAGRAQQDRGIAWLTRWLCASYALPATVLGLGSLLLLEQALPVAQRYGDLLSLTVLVLTLAARFVVFALLALQLGLALTGRGLDDNAAALGMAPRQMWLRVHFPALRGFVLLGALLVLLQTLRETAATQLLRPFSFETVALKAYSYLDIGLLPESAAWGVTLVLLGLFPLLSIESMLPRQRPRADRHA